MSIFRSWNGPITPTYCPYKGDLQLLQRFPLEERSPVNAVWTVREIRILPLRRSKDMSRSIPIESMRSQSNFQRRVNRQRAVTLRRMRNYYEPNDTGENKALVLDAFDTLFKQAGLCSR